MCVFLVQSDLWTFAKYLELFEDKLVDSTATMLDTHMHTTSEYAHARVYHLASIVGASPYLVNSTSTLSVSMYLCMSWTGSILASKVDPLYRVDCYVRTCNNRGY